MTVSFFPFAVLFYSGQVFLQPPVLPVIADPSIGQEWSRGNQRVPDDPYPDNPMDQQQQGEATLFYLVHMGDSGLFWLVK